jgi:dihydrofolate reductase
MRKLILKMSVTVDGFVSGPDGRLDWLFDSMDDTAAAWTLDSVWQAGVHIMGSRTFHDMAAYWPTSSEPFAAPMNAIPKVVFSRTGDAAAKTTRGLDDARARATAPQVPAQAESWNSARWIVGDLAEGIAKLKAEDGKPIVAHGGASFARSLVALDVIDEYRLLVHPIVLGRGLPLFSELAAPRALRLASAQAFAGGAVAHVYTPA